jgi:hypothetical protein
MQVGLAGSLTSEQIGHVPGSEAERASSVLRGWGSVALVGWVGVVGCWGVSVVACVVGLLGAVVVGASSGSLSVSEST